MSHLTNYAPLEPTAAETLYAQHGSSFADCYIAAQSACISESYTDCEVCKRFDFADGSHLFFDFIIAAIGV